MVAPGQTAYLRCEVIVPHDVNNNSVASVRWYRSMYLNLINSEDVTEEYKTQKRLTELSTAPGLFRETHGLIIPSISSADDGFYWYRIITVTNESCSDPSPYVNVFVGTESNNSDPCPSISYTKCANVSTCETQSLPVSSIASSPTMNTTSLNVYLRSSVIISSSLANAGICMTKPDVERLEFTTCLGVTIPTAGFVLILIILFICCAGIYVCRRKNAKQKGKQKLAFAIPHTAPTVNDQRSAVHAESNSISVPSMPPNHSYEEVDINNPLPVQAETLYDEVVVTSHQRLHVEDSNCEGENMESHTYETVLSERANENKRESSIFPQARKTDSKTNRNDHSEHTRPKKISDANLSTRNVGSQYNDLVVNDLVQKDIVKAVIEESAMKDQLYNTPLTHKLSLVNNSSEDSAKSKADNWGQREGSPHIYQKLDHHNTLATQAPTSQETTLKKPMESTGDHEYHVLEEANAQHNRSISGPFKASDTATPAREGTSREQILSEFKQSPAVVFDDPLYSEQILSKSSSATQALASQETTLKKPMKSTGDHEYHVLEEANAQHNRSTSDALMASDTATPAREGTSREQIQFEFKQSSAVAFDDPLYSSFTNDKNSTEEASEEANINKPNPSTESELHVSNLHDPVSNVNGQLLSECDQNPLMPFDDPLYSMLSPDKRSTATPSQVLIDESDEQCHPPDTDNTVNPDELCFDDVQEICFQGQM